MEIFSSKILVVDDQPKWAEMIASILTKEGYNNLSIQYSVRRFADLLRNYDLAILDIDMKPNDGFQIKRYLQYHSPKTQVILTSGKETFGLDLIEKVEGISGSMTKKNIVKDRCDFILLVNQILEQRVKTVFTGCYYDILNNLTPEQLNRFGIQTHSKIKITEILQNLKSSLINTQGGDSGDLSECVDALAMALSKREIELKTVTDAFHAIRNQERRMPDSAGADMIDDLEKVLLELNLLVPPQKDPNQRVFIVHGHDETAKLTVARFLENLKLQPIILSEQPNRGLTIIENFEQNADVGYAVALLTPDDCMHLKNTSDRPTYRARQNVILELGYFIGRLGRKKVCALYKDGVEVPSDINGVIYIPMDPNGGWRMELVREMKDAGVPVVFCE